MLKQVITPQEATAVKKAFADCKNVVVIAHQSPDGDAIGSSLGMYEYLKRKGKNVTVIMPGYFPDFLHWMKDADKIVLFDRQKAFSYNVINMADLIVCLDFNTMSRIDELAAPVARSRAKKLLIDHHLNPQKSEFDIVVSRPEASSTCELVFRVLDAIGGIGQLTFAGAEDLYAGMFTDTGGFSFNSNDPDIFVILSELLRKGIDKDLINRRILNNYSADRMRFMGYVLYEKMVTVPELHASYICITREEMKRFNYLKGDLEGVVNMPLQIKGHKLSISLREDTEQDLIRVSTRSVDDLPCNEICAQFFNGGGHKNASGGKLACTMDEAVEITKRALEAWSDKLKDQPQ